MSSEHGGHGGPPNAAMERSEHAAKLVVRSTYQVIGIFIFGALNALGVDMQMKPEGEAAHH